VDKNNYDDDDGYDRGTSASKETGYGLNDWDLIHGRVVEA
jgi:hypothetical protein